MEWIILFIVVGLILFFVELVLLPGITVAAIGSVCSLVISVYLAFDTMGSTAGFITLSIVTILMILMLILFLRRKTWHRVTLTTNVKETVGEKIENQVALGAIGITTSRLAPMGKVLIDGKVYEAKSFDVFIDQRIDVQVIGFDNSNIIVKQLV